ncbi:hypothetical protein QNN00_16925 [Bacillus velezensis]|nr:hypothetical protein [Bacillus velezensis]
MRWISFILVLAQLSGMSMSGYVVSEWGWHAAFWIGSGLGLCLSFMIREMKMTAMFGFTMARKKSACCLSFMTKHALALLVIGTLVRRCGNG